MYGYRLLTCLHPPCNAPKPLSNVFSVGGGRQKRFTSVLNMNLKECLREEESDAREDLHPRTQQAL